ncbi:uncharacterized protein LOC131009384 [Salvia miltiorrhiza]|uniref:uncharacterized protein LOC131009384 n=1 Tax=Salvia miltiorrhiza TaxID=226208 RepID=UPI0025ABC4BC|nr:uncharacterized protein LOC131009384 [Salvia miltiorrhiza]
MSETNEDVKLSLKAMINKEKNKVLFAEADSHFVDILLSFLTLPLGRIIKILDKHYGDEAPAIGSLSSLYRSLANLDSAHFVTKGAKQTLLKPRSSFDEECERLKLDISDSHLEYFHCTTCSWEIFRSVSLYYDKCIRLDFFCSGCSHYSSTSTRVAEKRRETGSVAVFTKQNTSFIISDDLQILPNEMGIVGIVAFLGITDMDKAELINVDLGFNEIMNLLMTSLTSPTPLSDVILNKTNTSILESPPLLQNVATEENPKSKNLSLKLMIQKSSGRFLYAQAKEEFVEFLLGLLHIPLGAAEYLVAGKTCIKAIDNLYRSAADLVLDKYFKSPDTKKRLMKPNLIHGCISENYIVPLTQECLPDDYSYKMKWFPSSIKFPNGQGSYLTQPQTYRVADDLTVTPLCIVSTLSSLRKQKIPISDVEEVELKIGLKEAVGILIASLTSTSALSDVLLRHKSIEQAKEKSAE